MTEILVSSPSQFPSSPSSIPNDGTLHLNQSPLFNSPNSYSVTVYDTEEEEGGGSSGRGERKGREKVERDQQLSLLEVFVTVFRKSLVGCRSEIVDQDFTTTTSSSCSSSCYSFSSASMEIGCPTNVRHVAHVTFDRFNGFLGLPVEFEPEVPRRPPSARDIKVGPQERLDRCHIVDGRVAICPSRICLLTSQALKPPNPMRNLGIHLGKQIRRGKNGPEDSNGLDSIVIYDHVLLVACIYSTSAFGVSTESMQLSFDSRGNSVPTILLMMQRHLYARGGLQAEGIFRITAENSEEEYAREQLNTGVVPDDVEVHCLAGLIKAWFRELPNGLLDSIPPEEVMQAQSEEDCCRLVRRLPPTEASLLDWAINLMADVAQLEHLNKMNAHNVAMVFAPNMTQMADPLTALMHAVQVMNFLKTLIVLTLREREDSILKQALAQTEPSDDNEHHHHSSLQPIFEELNEANEEEHDFMTYQPFSESPLHPNISHDDSKIENDVDSFLTSIENIIPGGKGHLVPNQDGIMINRLEEGGSSCPSQGDQQNSQKKKIGHSSTSLKKGPKRVDDWSVAAQAARKMGRNKGSTIASRLNSRTERVEAWR